MVVLRLDVFSVSMEVFLRPACSFHLVSYVSGKNAHAVTYSSKTSQPLQRTDGIDHTPPHATLYSCNLYSGATRTAASCFSPSWDGGSILRISAPARRKPFRLYYSLTWCVVFVIGRYILTAPQRCPGGAQAAMTRLKASSRIDVLRHHLLR